MKLDLPAEDEYALIFDSWAASYKKSPWAGTVTNDMWPEVSRRTMQDILDRGARVIVSVVDLPGGGRRVAGYSVSEPEKKILHYLYVKRDYRGMRMGTNLLEDVKVAGDSNTGWTYSHRTTASARFLGPSFEYYPVSARVKS